MECVSTGSQSICCGRPVLTKSDYDRLSEESNHEDLDAITAIESSDDHSDLLSLECPEPAFTILDSSGEAVRCSDQDCIKEVLNC